MLVIRIIVLIIVLIAVVYGNISIAKHLANKRRPFIKKVKILIM